MSGVWSDEEIDFLKMACADGMSASAIARKLPGRSRSAVLGRIFRMGLSMVSSPVPRARVKATNKAPKIQTVKAPADVADEDLSPLQPPVDTMTVTDRHCRWPFDAPEGGLHYCGREPKPGHSWCEGHCKKAYQPMQSKKAAA